MQVNEKLRINLPVISFVTVIIAAVSVGLAFEAMRRDVRELTEQISEVQQNQYTMALASETALRRAIENPGHREPDPRDPSRVIVVRPRGSEQ